jgi:ParB family chromosome partitioning protein
MDEFHLTQDEIGQKMGKSRSQIANTIRLLQLPQEIQQALMDRKMSMSQARTLLSLPSDKERFEVFNKMMASHVTVREAEESISDRLGRRRSVRDPNVMGAENELRELYRCKVDIKRRPNGQGEIRFRFFSDEEFRALMQDFIEKNGG